MEPSPPSPAVPLWGSAMPGAVPTGLRLVAFDLETTGLDGEKARIVEFCFIELDADLRELGRWTELVNPGMPIPADTVKVHGITDEMVASRPAIAAFASRIQALVQDAVLVAHNHKFDLEILSRELTRAGQTGLKPNHPCIDTHQLEAFVNSHSLAETYKRYFGAEFAGAHRSEADTAACVEVLRKQRTAHSAKLPSDLEGLLVANMEKRRNPERAERNWLDHGRRFYADGAGIVHYNFGPHKGHPIFESVETRSFLDWMLRRDFPEDVKALVKGWLAAPPPAATPMKR